MFHKLLVANRGEIACRIIRSARALGVRTVAVYSEADSGAMHVALADEAYLIGPAPAADSYLAVDRILEAARRSAAEAVHPGYGFLAENADFAEAVAAAGRIFVGPPPAAIRAMGLKDAAKSIMQRAGVAVVPGYHGDDRSPEVLAGKAREIGYPVLIKATAGGGGKGMRRVDQAGEFADALAGARREAKAAFGDDTMLIEKLIAKPRHIEIQVFADSHGNVVHLFERDCSLQRRYQKVVEEAPAPDMPPAMRRAMGEAALAAARAIGYVGAGTVEFIADVADGLRPDRFYFMEMNTRLQVEHAVTEMITGTDLVDWQLRVAAGEPLPCGQDDLAIDGHAIEVRIYAEDPAADFLPATGRLVRLRPPPAGPWLRIDTGVREGDRVTSHYDPMIAKLIAGGADRAAALRRLRQALDQFQIAGLTTNLDFLRRLAGHPDFAAKHLDTGFIERHGAALMPAAAAVSDRVLALACIAALADRTAPASARDPHSPWHRRDGWRLNDEGRDSLRLVSGEDVLEVGIRYSRGGGYLLELPGGTIAADGEIDDHGMLFADLDGERVRAVIVRDGDDLIVLADGATHRLGLYDPLHVAGEEPAAAPAINAPLPGKIIQVLVEPGAEVAKGAPLIVLEAMKMEHTLTAPTAGRIARVNVVADEQVDEGVELLAFEDD